MYKRQPVNQIYVSDCEADDVIAYLAQHTYRSERCVIVSSDKDLYQLIYPGDIWWDYKNKIFSHQDLKNYLGFTPQNLSDYLGLMGDSVDNIPGAPGLGEKTAMALMCEYKSLDNLMDNIDTISDRVGKKFKRFKCRL